MKKAVLFGVGAVALLGAAGGAYWALSGPSEPVVAGGPATARLISTSQYINTISYVFGSDIALSVSFPPVQRLDGLVALGTSQAQVTPSGAELYDQSARTIATQATDLARRSYLMDCAPAKAPDEACAKTILERYGRLLFRRPLRDAELDHVLGRTKESITASGDFYQGVATGLSGLLVAPQFLFLIEETEPDPADKNKLRLTGPSMATRLSLLLWDAPPDEDLLAAAEKGELHTRAGLAREVDRMLASPRLERGVRAFFTDMLVFEKYETMAKDPVIYPSFTEKVASDSREETLRTLIDHLVVRGEDYRDIFTTRRTFITGDLGMVYKIPVAQPQTWNPYEFPAESGRGGILTQLSFLALYSHPGRSSPTIRGKGLRELFLCQVVPRPPPDVDFTGFEDTSAARTTRERLDLHRKDPTCAGCHKITDPIGLALENFDGAGQYRPDENGYRIDTTGELGPVAFKDAVGLGLAMRNDPATSSCVVNRVADYGRGFKAEPADGIWLKYVNDRFAEGGFRFPALLKTVATSKAFYAVAAPKDDAATIKTAAAH